MTKPDFVILSAIMLTGLTILSTLLLWAVR